MPIQSNTQTVENMIPMYVKQGSDIACYYGMETTLIQQDKFIEEAQTELIYFISDIASSKTAIKLLTNNNDIEVIMFKENGVLKYFNNFSPIQRQEIIRQVDPKKLAMALTRRGKKPKSNTVKNFLE